MDTIDTTRGMILNWASEIDAGTIAQARRTADLPILPTHVALMPDAHVGVGATVGSVIPTRGAVIPSAVGVDIGCGMIAARTSLLAVDLPESLDPILPLLEQNVPAGVAKGHSRATKASDEWFAAHPKDLGDLEKRALEQFGTLGSGNHFLEVCLDEGDRVWIVLHSGSRGVGNRLAQHHITVAKQFAKDYGENLEDPELAWLVEGTPEFQTYIDDLLWAQAYALGNRETMMDEALDALFTTVGGGHVNRRINCHHNFTQKETIKFGGPGPWEGWVTRKGAIRASAGMLGVIPGSMGTRSYIVRGLGNQLSYESCSHGAGRRMSRGQAKRTFTAEDLTQQMKGVGTWQADHAEHLIDEIPAAYKDIDRVMEDQKDLVVIVHTLHQIVNYKGA